MMHDIKEIQSARAIGAAFDAQKNNFDLLRLVAAFVVVLDHAKGLSGYHFDPVIHYTSYGSSSSLAVAVFFVCSGFLVMRSLETRDIANYIKARLLRIVPGLVAITCFEALVIGPIFFNGDIIDYLLSHGFRIHFENITLFHLHLNLPGVFENLPFKAMNGSLWTLPIEFLFYIALPFVAIACLWKRQAMFAAFLVSAAINVYVIRLGYNWGNQGPALVGSVTLYSATEMAILFMAGVALWMWRDHVPMSGGLAVCCVIALFAANRTIASPTVYFVAVPYLTIYLAMSGSIGTKIKRRIGDWSYSAYLLGWPIAQSVVSVIGLDHTVPTLMLTVAIIAPLSYLSWNHIEKPALALK